MKKNRNNCNPFVFGGLTGGAKAHAVLELCRKQNRPAWIITKGPKEEEAFIEDLKTLGLLDVLLFPAWEVLPNEESVPQKEIVAERLDTLSKLAQWKEGKKEKPLIVVTSVESLIFKTISAHTLGEKSFSFKKGESLQQKKLLESLVRLGFEPYPMVGQKGDFSHRGGIVDFFPLNSTYPVRVEFFGDEIESIRAFDPETQTSMNETDRIDLFLSEEKEFLLKSACGETACLLEYGSGEFLVFLDEPAELSEKGLLLEEYFEEHQRLNNVSEFLRTPWQEIEKMIHNNRQFHFSLLTEKDDSQFETLGILRTASIDSIQPLHLQAVSLQNVDISQAQSVRMLQSVKEWIEQKFLLTIYCNNRSEEERLHELLKEISGYKSSVQTKLGRLSGGFALPGKKHIFLSDEEMFGRYKVRRSRWKFRGASVEFPETEIADGDYVVHINYGIGRYKGLTTVETEEGAKEMMEIQYAEGSRLFVPLLESHLVELYQGFSEKTPELDRIGSTRWNRTKVRVEKAIRDYASDLLELQAERDSLAGTSFKEDTPWQREFEGAFIYEETPDQVKAIEAVKKDMEEAKPMDRLLCGDVGYGKTEVAVRAAFKAVMGGKQVAVLVPTTVLAQQHDRTFSERLADYPIIVECLSRFKTKGEQRKIITALKKGEIDIVIGTHRLVQSDVAFKELGLVIIDEEQRFGVRHKEKLKQLKRLTDVLTMTATPIPRTLYLSLIGVKDMSAIQTPPVDRQPIETHLLEYDRNVIREAVLRELNREGQVFFVHNRVESIGKMKKELQELIPEARIDIAHGQMHADELAMVMRAFVNGELDMLVCTTIIESGLDIPNANTILINRADRFGLAELYQLRGRVGRFKHKAYAYLLLPRDLVIQQEAKKRLKALMEHSSLGAGFKVAMKDLEIRGAGNILGEEQSGHIVSIGFDLYCKLLRKTVERLKTTKTKKAVDLKPEHRECQVRLGVEGSLPAFYIPHLQQRLKMYRRIGETETLLDLNRLRSEIADRYGPPPPEAIRLLDLTEIKLTANRKNLDLLELKEGKLLMKRRKEYLLPKGGWKRVDSVNPDEILLKVKKQLSQFERK